MKQAKDLVLQLQDVGMRFGQTQVLNGLTLNLRRGERLAIIGPNGAGKSTLFELISGRLQASSGQILLNGQATVGLHDFQLSRAGLARSFQNPKLFAALSVLDNLHIGVLGASAARYRMFGGSAQHAAARHRAESLLEILGLSNSREQLANTLSYAEQRALEIGLAVAGDAPILMLDEPTSGMSQSETRHFVSLIAQLSQGRSLLMVEHDMDVVFGLADRVAVLVQGRILACDTPQVVRADPRVQAAYLGARQLATQG